MDITGNTSGETNAHQVRVPCIVFFAVTPVFVAIRLWSRLHWRSGLGWDDWTAVVSFICVLAVQVLMMLACDYGFGQHIYNLSTDNRLMALELFYVAQIFYKITINLTKSSILLLYLRIFLQRWFRICCYTLMGVILAYMVATTSSSIWQCTPIRGAWDKSVHPECINLTKNWYANAGFSIATDVLILLLPMQPIWASNLTVNQKRALIIVFALGGFVTITSILRSTTIDFSTTTPDVTYDIASTLWTMIEQNVAIICACLPMCRKPLVLLFPSAFASASWFTDASVSHKYKSSRQSQTNNSSSGCGSGSGSGGDSGWRPYDGPKRCERISSIVGRHHDSESEEYILSSMPVKEDASSDSGAIRKTMRCDVTYGKRDAKHA